MCGKAYINSKLFVELLRVKSVFQLLHT